MNGVSESDVKSLIEELDPYVYEVEYDMVGKESFIHFHVEDGWDQSSTIMKHVRGTNMEPPGVKATGVTIYMKPSTDDFEEFIKSLPKRPGQYNASSDNSWIKYSNIDTSDLVRIVKYISKNRSSI